MAYVIIQAQFVLETIAKKNLFIPIICILCVSCNSNSDTPIGNSNDYSNVHNQTQSQPADWHITTNVKRELLTNESLSSSARMISVTTNNGVVLLTGTVASNEESYKVVGIVKRVPGVINVDNQLTILNP